MLMNLASAFKSFVAQPIQHRRPDLAWYRISQLLHDRTNGSFDKAYLKVASYLAPKVPLPRSPLLTDEEIFGVVENLERDGYMILPFGMTPKEIDDIKAFAFSTPAHGADINKDFQIEPDGNAPGEARYHWWMQDIAKIPTVQKMITEGPYCAIAQEYLGCRPVLALVTLFIDKPSERANGSYTYHYDNEGPGFLKFFFFLTDVKVGTGAHYFIAGSQANTKPKPVSRAGFRSEEELFNVYGRDREKIMQGPAGTILAEDTMGFHRGSSLTQNYRLMMQFEFSAIAVPTEDELLRPLISVEVPGLDRGISSIARKFYRRPK
jgi:hypothetical protein